MAPRGTQVYSKQSGINVQPAGPAVDATWDFTHAESVSIDCILNTLVGGTSPTVQFILERLSADGTTWVQLSAATALSVVSSSPSTGISTFNVGHGLAINQLVGTQHRIRHITTGGPTSATATINVYANPF